MPRDVVATMPLSESQIAWVRFFEISDNSAVRWAISQSVCHRPFDDSLFAQAVTCMVSRHAALRSSFDFSPGRRPLQKIHDWIGLDIHVVDLRDVSAEHREHKMRQSLLVQTAQQFELTHSSLMRLLVHQTADEEFRLIAMSHPALLDRWSLRAFHVEVSTRYCGLSEESKASSARKVDNRLILNTTHAERLAGSPTAGWDVAFANISPPSPEFWAATPDEDRTKTLEGDAEPATPLVACEQVNVPENLARATGALAARLGVSVGDVLLAVHANAIAAATGRNDVVIGVETDCWDRTAQRTLGMLTNTLPIKISVASGTWMELVHRAETANRIGRAFPYLSHLRIQRLFGVDRLLFSSFACTEVGVEAGLLDDSTDSISDTNLPFEGTVFAEYFYTRNAGSVALRLTAGPGLSVEKLRELVRLHVEALAHCVAIDQPHEMLSPLTARHRELVLRQWNGPVRPYPVEHCVHELVEQQVRRTPDALAVVDAERELTYRELNTEANRLAHRLRSLGVGVGSVIGVCARRDAALMVSFLGILKTGAAYLPLDPRQPTDRIAYMLDDSGAMLVLSDSTYVSAVPAGSWSVLRTDDLPDGWADLPHSDLGRTSVPADLMYVIYTSGSTGMPKGVEVPHVGISNYLGWCVEAYAAHGEGGAPVFSSVAFDMVVPNLYTPLIMGQRVCMLNETLDSSAIAERLTALAPFSFIKLTPGQLYLLSELLSAEDGQRLAGTLVVGADAFPVNTLRSWRRIDSRTPVLNEYGPTEASVGNAVYFVDGTEQGDLLPIGRPIPNTTMYVLDSALAPVPIGVVGELYIGGMCVVRGYANRQDLTAQRFVPDPFDERPGTRMYRTGDTGRWLPGGALAFLGRLDDQVKIRGYRVEPAEIEAALVEHPAISAAVVTTVGHTRETLALVGYYVSAPAVSPEEVRAHLDRRLPEYLVPSFLIPIFAVPLNANGKVDRKSLPAPGGRMARSRQSVAAIGEFEKILEQVWKEVFTVNSVSREDSVAVPGVGVAEEAQLAMRLSQVADIPTAATFRLVAGVRTFGELAERFGKSSPPIGRPASARVSQGVHSMTDHRI